MNLLNATVVALFALCTGMALQYYFGLRSALRRPEAELAEVRHLAAAGDTPRPAGEAPFIRMLVEVKNPVELAQKPVDASRCANVYKGG